MKLTLLSFLFLTACTTSEPKGTPAEIQRNAQILNEYFEQKFNEEVAKYPTWQTYLGMKTNYGKLDDNTEEFAAKEYDNTKQNLKEIEKFEKLALDSQSRLSLKLYRLRLEEDIESYKWRYHSYPVNQMFGFQSGTPAFLINMHSIANKQEAKDYISRLKEIKRLFQENIEFMKKQESMGILPPDFVYSKVLNDSQNVIQGRPFDASSKDSTLLEDFKKKTKALKISSAEKKALIDEAKQALKSHVLPSYKDLIAYVKHLDSKTNKSLGAWSLPNGEEFYTYRLKKITTTDLNASEIHDLGLKEVERIHNEMRKIMAQVKFKGTLQEFFQFMRSSPQFSYPNTQKGRDRYLKETKKIIAKMKSSLPKMFNTFPKAELEVKAVEKFREKSSGIAFYQGPSLFGDRPGRYYVNLYKMEDVSKYEMEALAYHEALPGHHMQIAIATELEGLPKFRRTGGYTAYAEGWGLYSELLPKEFGFYQDPYSDFGRLSMELWRACRLVVDTGIHAKKWSRQEAIDYLSKNTPNASLEIEKGVERYFVMPAQATAYKVGMIKILDLRKKAKEALGAKFDIRSFHDVVLRDGSIPLNLLEENVDSWIKASM